MMTDEMKLLERKQKLLKIKSDSTIYLSTGDLTEELESGVKNLKNQLPAISVLKAIEILLDYVERQLELISKVESSHHSF